MRGLDVKVAMNTETLLAVDALISSEDDQVVIRNAVNAIVAAYSVFKLGGVEMKELQQILDAADQVSTKIVEAMYKEMK